MARMRHLRVNFALPPHARSNLGLDPEGLGAHFVDMVETRAPRTIVVTGASRGIGAAIARELAEPGTQLLLLARTESSLQEQAEHCRRRGADASYLCADLGSAEAGMKAAKLVLDRVGPPDVLVLNAGISTDRAFVDSDLEDKLSELNVNYLAPLAMLQTLLPNMRGQQRSVVAVSSLTVHVPFPGNASYAASKAALFCLLRSLRLELKNDPLHIGAVLPGYTDTEMSKAVRTPLVAMSPARVAEAVRTCIEERRDCVVPGIANRVAARVFRSVPEISDPLAAVFGDFLISMARPR